MMYFHSFFLLPYHLYSLPKRVVLILPSPPCCDPPSFIHQHWSNLLQPDKWYINFLNTYLSRSSIIDKNFGSATSNIQLIAAKVVNICSPTHIEVYLTITEMDINNKTGNILVITPTVTASLHTNPHCNS